MLGLRNSWVCWMLDDACAYLGLIVENKTQERDKEGKPKWTIQQVLNGEATRRRASISELFAMSGAEVMDN